MRQPTGPTDLARGIAPFGFHAREIGEHIDGGVLRKLTSGRVVGAFRREPVGQRHGVIQGGGARSRAQHHRVQIRRHAGREHRKCRAFHFGLVLHHLVAGHKRLETVAGGDVRALRERALPQQIFPTERLHRPVENDARLRRTRGVGEHRLRGGRVGIREFEQLALSLRPGAPIRCAAVARHEQISLRRGHGVDGQHREAGDEVVLRDIAGGSFDEFRAPDLAAGFAGDEDISAPPLRAEDFSAARHGFVEVNATRRLMLWAVIEHARLVDHAREVDGMAGRESVVASLLDEEELVERIAVGQPSRPFLVGTEQIPRGVEGEGHRKA